MPYFSINEKESPDTSALQSQYAQLPLAFEPNYGQADRVVQYLVHHGQATTYFAGTDTVTSVGDEHVTMSLKGATEPIFAGTDELPSKTNYFIGSDESKWQSNVPNYQGIVAQNVYPGIDLKYYGTNSQLEYDFIVSPGTDPKQISLNFSGQQDLTLDRDGNLVFKLRDAAFILQAPVTYQDTEDGVRKAVTSSFDLGKDNSVKIALGDYDATRPLVIDPMLAYSTFFGGSGSDLADKMVLDQNGNAYFIGTTASGDLPTSSPFQAANAGGSDSFVTKFNPNLGTLVYSTYFGGSGTEDGNGIAIDSTFNAYITGVTSSTDLPTSSPYQAANAGGQDVFVAKLSPTGSSLVFATYLGDVGNEGGTSVAVSTSGNAFIFGTTGSANFPTASPFQASIAGSTDEFIAKFSTTGTALVYSTYLGGSSAESSLGSGAITVDASGNAYVAGYTLSTDFPTASPYQAANAGGGGDAYVAKLNAAGSALTYSTYLGGSGFDIGGGITIDSLGNAYVAGYTASTDFPTASPYQAANAGGNDVFVVKLNAAGSALTYSTYLGGSGNDQLLTDNIVVDASGFVRITGKTTSTNFPTLLAYQSSNAGSNDVFVTKLNAAGTALVYSTYLGGSGDDFGWGIALRLDGDVFVSGQTSSGNFPTASPYQASFGGGASDAFILQLSEHTVVVSGVQQPHLTFAIGSTTCDLGVFSASEAKFCTHTLSASSNATGGYVISYIPTTTLASGANTITAMAAQAGSVLGNEQFGLNLRANTAAGSFTSGNFGADPSGGSGAAMTGYNVIDQFKFDVTGDDIAQTTGASNTTTYTASFIANITAISEAGAYATPVTYNVVASY